MARRRRPHAPAAHRQSYGRLIDSHIIPHFGKGEPRAITRNAIEQWHGEIAQRTPLAANRALATLSAFLSWLEHDRKIDRNPAKGVKRRPENQRHIFLDAAEIEAAHAALDADNNRAAALALRLALLTGCRIGEVLHARSRQIDAKRAVWIKPAAHTKQKRHAHRAAADRALAIAQELLAHRAAGLRVPPRAGSACARRSSAAPTFASTICAIRRASALARGGASLMQIGKVLGHTAPATTARYAHLVDRDLVDLVERS